LYLRVTHSLHQERITIFIINAWLWLLQQWEHNSKLQTSFFVWGRVS